MQSEDPLITVIIPTYRRPTLLKRAIKSVLNQSFQGYKICVYDDASGDETKDVVTEFINQCTSIEYHCHAQRIGINQNFNFGLKRVTTPFFSILCDDDILLPDFFRRALESFNTYPDAMLSAGSTFFTNTKDILNVLTWKREGYYPAPEALLAMLKTYHPMLQAILFRKEAIDEVGVFDEEVGGPADTDYVYRIMVHCPIIVSNRLYSVFVRYASSASHNPDYTYIWPGWLKMIDNIGNDETLPPETLAYVQAVLKTQLQQMLFAWSLNYVVNGNLDSTYKCAEILDKYFNLKTKAGALLILAKIKEKSTPSFKLFMVLYKILSAVNPIAVKRRNTQETNKKRLQQEYGQYLRLLEFQ